MGRLRLANQDLNVVLDLCEELIHKRIGMGPEGFVVSQSFIETLNQASRTRHGAIRTRSRLISHYVSINTLIDDPD